MEKRANYVKSTHSLKIRIKFKDDKIEERSQNDLFIYSEKKNFLEYALNLARALVRASLENARQVCQLHSLIENQNQIQRFLVHALNLARALVRVSLENARQLYQVHSQGLFSDVSIFEFDSDFQSMNGLDIIGALSKLVRTRARAPN